MHPGGGVGRTRGEAWALHCRALTGQRASKTVNPVIELARGVARDERSGGRSELRRAPPPLRRGVIARPRLVGKLARRNAARIISITAPPGGGKTTLLAQLDRADERPYGWLILDERDRDPARFAIRLAHGFAALGADDVAGRGPLRGRRSARAPFVLVIDNCHLVDDPGTFAEIADRLPPGAAVALAGRTPPMELDDRLAIELGAGELAMTADEAAAMLTLAGIELGPESVSALVEATDGWPAGIHLASLALAVDASPETAARRFSGRDRLIGDYLRLEALSDQAPGDTEFLVRTSLLDRPSASGCNAVLERTDSEAALARIAGSNLFVVPLPDGRFRYHTAFRAMLLGELRTRGPSLSRELHRRAAAWCERIGDRDAAVHHACLAGDIARAGDLIWADVPEARLGELRGRPPR